MTIGKRKPLSFYCIQAVKGKRNNVMYGVVSYLLPSLLSISSIVGRDDLKPSGNTFTPSNSDMPIGWL